MIGLRGAPLPALTGQTSAERLLSVIKEMDGQGRLVTVRSLGERLSERGLDSLFPQGFRFPLDQLVVAGLLEQKGDAYRLVRKETLE